MWYLPVHRGGTGLSCSPGRARLGGSALWSPAWGTGVLTGSGGTSVPEKEVMKECARVPATGTPRSCPASMLLLPSKPGVRASGKVGGLQALKGVSGLASSSPKPGLRLLALTAQVAVGGGGETPVGALSPPKPQLQQPLLRSCDQAKPRGVRGDEAAGARGQGTRSDGREATQSAASPEDPSSGSRRPLPGPRLSAPPPGATPHGSEPGSQRSFPESPGFRPRAGGGCPAPGTTWRPGPHLA